MSDDDLIRREDAITAAYEADSLELLQHGAVLIAERIRALPAAEPAEDVRAGAHQAGMILGLQMAADIASAHDYTIQSASAADLRAVQICNAILDMIPEAKP